MKSKLTWLALAAAIFLAPLAAQATVSTVNTTLSSTSYTDLGVGPIELGAVGNDLGYTIADSQPSVAVKPYYVKASAPSIPIQTASHVWGIALTTFATKAVVAPITGWGGSGGGGGGGAATIADGASVTFGSEADAKSTATDTTPITAMQVLKEISAMEQTPPSRAVTAVSGGLADGALATLGAKADAKNTATDTTAITVMQVLKEISAMEQAPATRAVTAISGGLADGAVTTVGAKADARNAATDTTAITAMQVWKEISYLLQNALSVTVSNTNANGSATSANSSPVVIASDQVAVAVKAASGTIASGAIADGAEVTLGAKADAKNTATDTTAITVMQVLKEISAMEQAPASRAVTNAGTFATQSTPTPGTSGGLSDYFVQPAASDNHANIKNGAGQVYHIKATNNSATINYLRLYNAGTGFNGCNSATNLVDQWAIPANTSGAGFVEDISEGIAFATGISICVTSGYATTDTTNATASAMSVSIGYK